MKRNWPITIAGILLCLVLFTTSLVSGLYARYTARGESSDSARVAKFTIDMNSQLLDNSSIVKFDLTPGETNYAIEIENESEVAVISKIQVINITKNIPFTFAFDGNELDSSGIAMRHALAPNSTETINFTINWVNDDTALNYIGMVDLIEIHLDIEQVD